MITYEINFSPKDIDEKGMEGWGAAFIWKGDLGCEYNLAYDSEGCCSAIYPTKIGKDGFIHTDYEKFISYKVDKESDRWAKDLIIAMEMAYHEFWRK